MANTSENAQAKPRRRRSLKRDDEDDIDSEDDNSTSTGTKKKSGINWTAVFLLSLFVVPAFFTIVITAVDFFYPEAASARKIRDKVVKCYTAANPKKLTEVDYLMKKYKGNEHVLFAQLRAKYEDHPECQ